MHKFSLAMAVYSNAVLTDMRFISGRANRITTDMHQRLYGEAYSNYNNIPSHCMFLEELTRDCVIPVH